MWAEMLGKGGRLCQEAKSGALRCPLLVRPTSEDVLTGEIFEQLHVIAPRWWLPEFLNVALGLEFFRRQVYRRFRVELWKNRPPYPRRLLPWNEGSTQVDVTITWENPPTTIFVEMKFGSKLSPKTSTDNGQHGFPSDQLIRNLRVGLLECGWFDEQGLITRVPRQFRAIVFAPKRSTPEVGHYQCLSNVLDAIPHSNKLRKPLPSPLVGEVAFSEFTSILERNARFMTRCERLIADQLCEYLNFKSLQLRNELESRTQTRKLLLKNDPSRETA